MNTYYLSHPKLTQSSMGQCYGHICGYYEKTLEPFCPQNFKSDFLDNGYQCNVKNNTWKNLNIHPKFV